MRLNRQAAMPTVLDALVIPGRGVLVRVDEVVPLGTHLAVGTAFWRVIGVEGDRLLLEPLARTNGVSLRRGVRMSEVVV
jgi:hypothetical protein